MRNGEERGSSEKRLRHGQIAAIQDRQDATDSNKETKERRREHKPQAERLSSHNREMVYIMH